MEKYQSRPKQIDGYRDIGLGLYKLPQRFRLVIAVDARQHQYTAGMELRPQLFYFDDRLFDHIAIDHNEVEAGNWWLFAAQHVYRTWLKPIDKPHGQSFHFIPRFARQVFGINHLIHQSVNEGRVGAMARMRHKEVHQPVEIKA